MKYILMMSIPKTGYEVYGAWSPEDIKANIGFVRGLNKRLSDSGEFVAADGLSRIEGILGRISDGRCGVQRAGLRNCRNLVSRTGAARIAVEYGN